MRFTLLLIIALISPLLASAQTEDWQYYYGLIAGNDADEGSQEQSEELFEHLSSVAASPLNINTIDRTQLEELGFLSNVQIDAVLEYVNRYAPLVSKAELMMIPRLDNIRRNLLACLVYVGEGAPRDAVRDNLKRAGLLNDSVSGGSKNNGFIGGDTDETVQNRRWALSAEQPKADVTSFFRLPLYEREGDKNGYAGYKYKHFTRATFNINNKVKAGFVASQDPGEPFFAGRNKCGYDYYSAFLQLKNMGVLRNLVVGQYRIRTGLGLVVNRNLSLGHGADIASYQAQTTVLRPHTSRSEANYLQGAAANIMLSPHFDATVFGSVRPIDATLTDEGEIKTVVGAGYHRTASELAKKHNAWQYTAGSYLRYSRDQLRVGLTAVYDGYNIPMKPWKNGSTASQRYRQHYPAGQHFWNVSVDYGYKIGRRIRLDGETATGDCRQIATVNTLSWQASKSVVLYSIWRYYPYKYYATLGRSFAAGGSNQDESGVYVGFNYTSASRLSLSGYVDAAYFAWPKYMMSESGNAFTAMMEASFATSSRTLLTARYNLRLRHRTVSGMQEQTLAQNQRLKLSFSTTLRRWQYRTDIAATYWHHTDESVGFMLSQMVRYSMKPWKISATMAYFNTGDYNSRVFVYEQGTPYNMSLFSLYGHGARGAIMAERSIGRQFVAVAKTGLTHYFDRNEIGTGKQKINGSTQSEIELCLRWRLNK